MLDHLGAASCMLAQNLQEGDYKGVFLQVFDGILCTPTPPRKAIQGRDIQDYQAKNGGGGR